MNLLAALVALTALPVTTPGELGRLRVTGATQTPASTTFAIAYENDTDRDFEKVRVMCVLIDHRGEVVFSDAVTFPAQRGAEVDTRLRVVDSSQRAVRGECTIESAR